MAALKQRSERTWSAGEALFSRMCGAEVAIHGSEGDRRGIVDMMTTKSERANIRILIVDDFSSIRKIVRKLLASLGFMHVAEARDASEAVRRLQQPDHL